MPWVCFPGEAEDKWLAICGHSEDPARVGVKSGQLWSLRSFKCPWGASNFGLMLPHVRPPWYKTQPHLLFPEVNLTWNVRQGREVLRRPQTASDLSLDVPVYKTPCQAIIWLFLQTFIPPLGSFLYIFFSPFRVFATLCGTKQNFSHCLLQGILSPTFVVLTTSLLLPCRAHQRFLSNKDCSLPQRNSNACCQ